MPQLRVAGRVVGALRGRVVVPAPRPTGFFAPLYYQSPYYSVHFGSGIKGGTHDRIKGGLRQFSADSTALLPLQAAKVLYCLHVAAVFCRRYSTFAASSGKSAVLSAENGMHVQTVQHFCYPKMQKCCTVCTKSPKSHRSIRDFMGVNSPILRPILEGPRGHNPYCWRTDLVYAETWRLGDDAASRSDPTFTRASQGLRQ